MAHQACSLRFSDHSLPFTGSSGWCKREKTSRQTEGAGGASHLSCQVSIKCCLCVPWTGQINMGRLEEERSVDQARCLRKGSVHLTGFPRRLENLENLENENVHEKVMEHEILAKSHGIMLSVINFYPFCPQIVPIL